MKKILILLIAAYVGVLAYEYYHIKQIAKTWNDPKWQYCLKVLYNSSFIHPTDTFLYKWNDDFRVFIYGKPTAEDKKSLEKYVALFNELISPRKITVYYELSGIGSKINPNLDICYKTEHKYCPCSLMHDTISAISYRNDWTAHTTMRNSITTYKPNSAWLTIMADSSEKTTRNHLVLKGLTYILLCFDQSGEEWVDHFDERGNLSCHNVYDPKFPNSIFNPNCCNCTELAEIDKYIIKTFYSQDIGKKIETYNLNGQIQRFSMFFPIEIGIVIAIFIVLYFTGYFEQIFAFLDRRIRLRWLAINSKVLFVIILFSIAYTITNYLNYYVLVSSVFTNLDKPAFSQPSRAIFYLRTIFIPLAFWIAYILIPVNCIYLIERVIFPKFNQFAKQQLFSFIALVASISILVYLLKGQELPMYLGMWWVSLSVITIIGIARFLYNYTAYQKKLAVIDKEQEISKLHELKTRAELNALQSKINPHFLYNALNSIAGLAHENPNKVEQMALALSKLFRYSINKEDSDFATVQNEVEMVSIYLDIEKVRFDDMFRYELNVPKDMETEIIPKFIVQPLVENAIKHGISQIASGGLLTLSIFKDQTKLTIKVSDNGPNFPEDLMTGYGLQNIYEKLDILYPDKYEVKLQNGTDKNISIILTY